MKFWLPIRGSDAILWRSDRTQEYSNSFTHPVVAPLGVFLSLNRAVRATRLLLLAVLLLPGSAALAAVNEPYLAELIEKSSQLRLAERPEWHKLLHYVPNLVLPGVHSLVDSPQFFNARDGRDNPRSELEATLASFFSGIEETSERQNPQCAFIARYAWLDQQLAFDPLRLPRRECRRYRAWHAALNPKGLTLIFPTAYLNNPSSMYGHTLLRVDARDQDERTRLLAYTINFAASTDETNGLVFAVKGLLGGYAGTFSMLPYYIKVREYSEMENRDIWEYELDLAPDEVDRVLMHAWELGPSYFQYYFFDENCSYHLLGLLQVARPEMNLTDRFRWWAIPSDTVRAVTEYPGLVRNVVYRPANATVIRHRLGLMDGEELRLVMDLSMQRISPEDPAVSALPPRRAAAVLEASYDYVEYLRAGSAKDNPKQSRLARELLLARSRIDVSASVPPVIAPEVRPDQGHASSRVTLGVGRRGGQNFQEVQARAAYHDIMDPAGGYVRGAQIEFFDLRVRHYESSSARVERLTLVDILSLVPRDDFFHPWSWKIAGGWQRMFATDGSEPLAFGVDGGAGGAWSTADGRTLAYVLLDGSTRINGKLDNGYALGAGASLGVVFDAAPSWRLHGYARELRYFLGQEDTSWEFGLQQRLSIRRNLALRLDLARRRELDRSFGTTTASVLLYF